jgi:hypothetical protein
MVEAPESERPTLPHAPPPELLRSMVFENSPTRRVAPVSLPNDDDVDAGWTDEL